MSLWPDQFVNRKVQEHDLLIPGLLARIVALEEQIKKAEPEKPKRGRPPKES